jgi:hypothetical protein
MSSSGYENVDILITGQASDGLKVAQLDQKPENPDKRYFRSNENMGRLTQPSTATRTAAMSLVEWKKFGEVVRDEGVGMEWS